jgi:DNA-binding transcriptional LysR family regulator
VDWDDFRILMAVADAGTLDAAARALETQMQVVTRRLDGLESALNCELVTRTASGVELTASGQKAVAIARAFHTQITSLAGDVGGAGGEIRGTVCVTSTAGFVPRALSAIQSLRVKYPKLNVDVMVSSHVVNLKAKEADIAVRMFRDPTPGLGMDKLGEMGWSLYGSEKYLAAHPRGANLLDGQKFIAYDSNFVKSAGGRWIGANVSPDAITMHVGGLRQALDAAAAHQGLCIVPCYLSDEHKVVRYTNDVLTVSEVFAVYLAERQQEARLRVVVDSLLALFERERVVFGGTVA